MSMRCPICGINIESAKRHLRRYHGVATPSEEFARSILALYRIFRKKDEFVPLVPLEEWEYSDFLKVMNILGTTSLPLRKKIILFEPLAEFFAERFSAKILEEFPTLVRKGDKSTRALAFITLTFVRSENAISAIIELCDRGKSTFLEYIVDAFQRFKDSLKAHIKRAIDGNRIPSPSCVFKAIFIAHPNIISDLITYFIQKESPTRKDFAVEELSELFDYMVTFPKRYFAIRPTREALLISAKAKFFGDLEIDVPEERLDKMIRQYVLLTKLDDMWSRLYHGCQTPRGRNIYEQMKGVISTETALESLLLRVSRALDEYPEACTTIGKISIDEYLEAMNDLEGEYLRGLFLYIMADINLKNGHLERALFLLEKLKDIVKNNYDYIPHALLAKAIAQEFLGLYEDAIKTYERLKELKAPWEVLLLNEARLYVITGRFDAAKNILSKTPANLIYKLILEAFIAEKTASESYNTLKEKLLKYIFTPNPQMAFRILIAMEYACHCLYQRALETIWSDKDLRRIFLDLVMLSCPRHGKIIVQEASKKFPDDKILNYYLGVIAIEEERYDDALRFFENAEDVDKKPLLINKLLAAIMANRSDVAERTYRDLEDLRDSDEVIELAIIHYLMYAKRFSDAYNRLGKIRDLIDYEMYLGLQKDITQRRFTMDKYIYYITSRALGETVCPLLSALVE